jgi:hypothetical protein
MHRWQICLNNYLILNFISPHHMNYIEKQLLLSSAVKAIDFLSCTTAPAGTSPLIRFNFEEESLSSSGMDPMQTLDLLHQQGGYAQERADQLALCMPEVITPALATSWLISSWSLKIRAKVFDNRAMINNIRMATEKWLRAILPVEEQSSFQFHADLLTANFRALIIARDALLKDMNWDSQSMGLFNAPRISVVASSALSQQALTALSLAGFGRRDVTFVPTRADGTLDIERMPKLHERTILYLQAMHPITGVIENGEAIRMAKSSGAWVHVDAPVALWMNLAPGKDQLFTAYRLADSWVTDSSMWFECPDDIGILACRHQRNSKVPTGATLPAHYGAITALWASLRSLGKSGIESRVARSTVYAAYIADKLLDSRVEVLAGPNACHVLIAFEHEELAHATCDRLMQEGFGAVRIVNWAGKMRVLIPLITWKQTPEWIESIIAIVRETAADSANLASA